MRLFILDGDNPHSPYALKKREKNYLFNVLRLKKGDRITARDRGDNYYEAILEDESTLMLTKLEERPEETITDHLSAFKGSLPSVHIYQCICKGKKNETITRMMYEAGVASLTFVSSKFTQEKDLGRHEKERLEKIMMEAVSQSGSTSPVRAFRIISFSQALDEAEGEKIILHQSEESTTLYDRLKNLSSSSTISLFIGSEGGFSDEECAEALSKGASVCLMTTNILRAETAGIFALGAIQNVLGKLLK